MNTSSRTRAPKRPASHVWALLVYLSLAAVNILLNRLGHFDVLGVVVTIAGVAAFFASLFFARSRVTYTLGILTLALAVVRSLQSLWFDIAAYRQSLFHAPHPGLRAIVFAGCVPVLLLWLFRAYTYGASSRQYYGLPPTPNRPAPDADPGDSPSIPDPTTTAELQRALTAAGVSPEAYSFTSDGPGERYRLQEFQDALGPRWHYYYAERGEQTGLRTFRSEPEACAYFLRQILRDPTTRIPRRA